MLTDARAIVAPLRIRDFALLWSGFSISLLGDGIYLVAIAWQVYELSNVPTALSVVGVAWTLPQVLCLLVGGAVSDRYDRRRILIAADLVRALAIGTLGVLAATGTLQLWHVLALVAVYGAAEGFFYPAFGALVPDIVPDDLLVHANALDQLMRPAALRFIGPALGGWVVAVAGTGGAFLLDGASFLASAVAVSWIRRPSQRGASRSAMSIATDIADGLRFVQRHRWLWATLVASTIALLATWGPIEVLVPFVVKNELGGGPDDLGLVFAAGGLGSVLAAAAVARHGLPARNISFVYLAWAGAGVSVAGYGLAPTLWQAALASLLNGALLSAGLIVWTTLLQTLVPQDLRGRVMSVDWMVSIGLVPVSFALVGPVVSAAGTHVTLLGAAIVAALPFVAFVFIPGVRYPETVLPLTPATRDAAADPGR